MTEYVMESFHDLRVEETELPSTSDSSRGAISSLMNVLWQVPPRDTSKASTRRRPPTNDLDDEVKGDTRALPRLRMEQLKAWHQELKEA